MNRRRVGLVVALAGTLAAARAGDLPDFARRSAPPAPIGLPLFAFDGRSLAGFSTFLRDQHGADPAGVFAVVAGQLRISGEEYGGITTKESFADYHLVAEWRWGGPTHYPRRWRARNSGIMVHCIGAEGDGLGAWMAGLESQLIEGGTGDLLPVPGREQPAPSIQAEVRTGADGQPYFRPGGAVVARSKGRINWWGRDPAWRDILWFRGPDDLDRPVGQWNRTELVCRGDRVSCYLNGRLVNAAGRLGRTAGRILFQSEGAEIWFRRIEVRACPPGP